MNSKSNKLVRLVSLLAILALVVAACGDNGDAEGVVTIQPGESIQIRAHQAISGPEEPLGQDQVRGVDLAITDFGDIHGFPVDRGTAEDDTCSAEGGTSGAQAIVAQDDVLAVIGTTCSGAAVPAIPVITGAGMVMFSGSNTSPSLTSDMQGTAGESWHAGYYRTAHNDLFQGAAVALFVYENLGLTRAAAIHDGDPYTVGLTGAFRDAFEELGGEVPVYVGTTGVAGADQSSLLAEVSAEDVEVVFFPIFPQSGGPEVIEQGVVTSGLEDVVWIGADGLFGEDFISISATEGMYFSGPDLDFGGSTSATGKTYTEMVADYTERFGTAPPAPFHAHTYDATVLVLSAIEAVAVLNDDGSLTIDRQGLRDWLDDVTDFPGLIGTLTCDEFGDCGSQRIQVAHHTDSSVTDISLTPVVATYEREDLLPLITGE